MATPDEIAAERDRRRRAREAPRAQGNGPSADDIAQERWRRRYLRQQENRDAGGRGGAPAQPQRAPGALDWDENGRLIVPERPRPPQPRVETGEDVVRSFGAGVPRGVAALYGLPADLSRMFAGFVRDNTEEGSELHRGAQRRAGERSAGFAENVERIEEDFGPLWEPQTGAGEFARTTGEFATGAIFPGSLAARASRVVVPAAGSEAGGVIGRELGGEEGEIAGRILGGIGGGVATEAGIAANSARAGRIRPNAEALADEAEFGPYTSGERSGNQAQRRREYRWRMGVGSDQAEAEIRSFDAMRAPTIRENAFNIVTRGRPALSQNVDEAGVVLGDELRSAREALRSQKNQLYDEATPLLEAEAIPPTNNTLIAALDDAAQQRFARIPTETREAIMQFEREVVRGNANHARLEEVRKALNRDLSTAMRQGNARDEFIIDELIDALDGWQAGRLTNPQARRAIQEARAVNRELRSLYSPQNRVELASGHQGARDPGGAAIERVATTDMTGEQIVDALVGAGARPSGQALSAVRRIKDLGTQRIIYTNRNAESGVRVPGRQKVGGQTAGERRFAADDPNAPPTQQNPRGGMEQPEAVLQALREGLSHRLLRDMDDYLRTIERSGTQNAGVLPAQTMVKAFDHALNRGGRQIMEILYTQRELQAMRRLLRYLQRLVPPIGAHAPSTPGLYSLIAAGFSKLASLIPAFGPVLREMTSEALSTGAARQAIRPPAPARPARPVNPANRPQAAVPAYAGAITPREEEPRRVGRVSFAP